MTSNVSELMMQARELSLQERRELIRLLNDTVMDESSTPEHSILELAGLGAEIWEGLIPRSTSDSYAASGTTVLEAPGCAARRASNGV